MEIGQVVVKLNGRYAGYYGYIKEIRDGYIILGIPINEKYMKEKKSNIKHVLPIPNKKVDVSKIASPKDAVEMFKQIGVEVGKRIRIE